MFFLKAVEQYLEFFVTILNSSENNNDAETFNVPNVEFEFFSEPSNSLKKYNRNIEFKKLYLNENTYNSILKVCKSAVEIGFETHPEIFKKTAHQILNILEESKQLYLQILSLDFLNYILKFLKDNFENINIATHLARVVKYVGQNIQKYKKLDIVSEKEYKYFLNVHKDFYTNIFWKNVERKDLSEIILIAVADSLNSIYNSNDISYTFVFISKLIEQNGKTIISLKDLKQFQDHKIPEANLLVIQHLALCHDSELEFKESLKVLNISSKIDTLDGILEKVTLFKNIKMCYLNFKQKMEFSEKGISISKNYYFNSDLLFESYELFVLKFLKIAKNSSDYIRILEILAVILEEEKFQKYLFQGIVYFFIVLFYIYFFYLYCSNINNSQHIS